MKSVTQGCSLDEGEINPKGLSYRIMRPVTQGFSLDTEGDDTWNLKN
jgi:hypothetical protein